MEKLAELFKNRKFVFIFTGFIALIGLILIFRKKAPESSDLPKNHENEELKNQLKEQKKSLKLLEKKNRELEEKANGKSITGKNSTGKPKPTEPAGEEGQGASGGDDEGQDELESNAEGDAK